MEPEGRCYNYHRSTLRPQLTGKSAGQLVPARGAVYRQCGDGVQAIIGTLRTINEVPKWAILSALLSLDLHRI
jgi:hypothetical protein